MLAVYQKDFLRAAPVAVPRAIYLHTPERSMCVCIAMQAKPLRLATEPCLYRMNEPRYTSPRAEWQARPGAAKGGAMHRKVR